jgi:hypothetical protein
MERNEIKQGFLIYDFQQKKKKKIVANVEYTK